MTRPSSRTLSMGLSCFTNSTTTSNSECVSAMQRLTKNRQPEGPLMECAGPCAPTQPAQRKQNQDDCRDPESGARVRGQNHYSADQGGPDDSQQIDRVPRIAEVPRAALRLLRMYPSDPSPGPLRLVKAPAAGHPLPGERAVFLTSTRPRNDSPLPGEGARRRRAGEGFLHSMKLGTR